jgi:CelD/BcsL family acetyltransferase involved in cellulose biosynthesis
MEIKLVNEFPADLKETWNSLLEEGITNVPFLRYEYLENWWSTRGGGEWPETADLAIFLGYEEGHLVGIAPLFIAERGGSKHVYFVGSFEISDYLDFIVPKKFLIPFLKALLSSIKTRYIDTRKVTSIDFYNLMEKSPSVQAVAKAGLAVGFKISVEKLSHSPFIKLPGDWEEYLASIDKKQRHEIRRKMRRAAEDDIPAEVYITKDKELLEEDIEAFLALMAHDPEKVPFLTEKMRHQMKQTMRCAFDSGCLWLAFLTIGNEKAAAFLSFDYLNRIWVYNSGLDRRFTEYSPGWVLLGHLLQWAIENKREEFDFMRGNEHFKYKFGAVDRFLVKQTLKL